MAAPSGSAMAPVRLTSEVEAESRFSMYGGGGYGEATGGEGTSPWVPLDSLDLNETFAWNARIAYEPPLKVAKLRLIGDYVQLQYSGTDTYDGPAHPVLVWGQEADADYDIGLASFSADLFLDNMRPGPGTFTVFPRLQFLSFSDEFRVTNTVTGLSSSGSKDLTMYGIGLGTSFDVGKITGLGSKETPLTLDLVATFGVGSADTKYYSYEAMLKLFQTCADSPWEFRGVELPTFTLAAEAGIVGYEIREGEGDYTAPGITRDDHLDVRLTIPIGRASVTF
jgi:hypothetical protein